MRFKKKEEEPQEDKDAGEKKQGMLRKSMRFKKKEDNKDDSKNEGEKKVGLFGKSIRKSTTSKKDETESNLGSVRGEASRKSLFGKKKDKDEDSTSLADEKGSKVRKSLFGKKKENEKEENTDQKAGSSWGRSLGSESSLGDSGLEETEEEKTKGGSFRRSPFSSRRSVRVKSEESTDAEIEKREKEDKEKLEKEKLEKQKELEKQLELEEQQKQRELERQQEIEKKKELENEKKKQQEIEKAAEEKRQKEEAERKKREAERAAYGTTPVKIKSETRGIILDDVEPIKEPAKFTALQRKIEVLGTKRDLLDTYSRQLYEENENLRMMLFYNTDGKSF